MLEDRVKNWPRGGDFHTDPLCQERISPFITRELRRLHEYDDKRKIVCVESGMKPEEITYLFAPHSARAAHHARDLCKRIGLGDIEAMNVYWQIMLHDIGKTRLPVNIWDRIEKPEPGSQIYIQRKTHPELGADAIRKEFSDNLDHWFIKQAIEIALLHHEKMDGTGQFKIPGEELSLPVRLAIIVDAFDGGQYLRPHHVDANKAPAEGIANAFGKKPYPPSHHLGENRRDVSIPGVLQRMCNKKGAGHFDMELLDAFEEMMLEQYHAKQKATNAYEKWDLEN
ncbi:MAG: HD domain-containing protein [Alphaproteobacteria bacterium]|nr:HD domain-containing protein [Alphaproteobacteria bacterium]